MSYATKISGLLLGSVQAACLDYINTESGNREGEHKQK